MPIDATDPTVVSATYNLWAVASLQIAGDGCVAFGQTDVQPVSVSATLVKARVLSDGKTWERSPLPSDIVRLQIPDAYAFIATGTPQAQAIEAALQAVETAVNAYGAQQGAF